MKHLYPFTILALLLAAGCKEKTVVSLSESGAVAEKSVEMAAVKLPETISYNEQIQPILSE